MATRYAIQTEDDLCGMPDDGQRYELIEGEIVVSPSPGRSHQKVVGRLHVRLQTFVEADQLGEVLLAPFDVKLAENTIVQPDILFVSSSRSEALTEQRMVGAPDLVVEVMSPSTRVRDEGVKMAVYGALSGNSPRRLHRCLGCSARAGNRPDRAVSGHRLAHSSPERFTHARGPDGGRG
ncbi:MAG: Uma2 family endonuclease [Chloroflexota bacterium]|nr:Uma2 family endonuclease [Chloroflexota bacterium]